MMGKFSPSLFLALLLFFSAETTRMEVVDAKTCKIALLGCNLNSLCNQQCFAKYNGRGSCYRPPGTFLNECMCWYPC
uniref:Uncharacterized protein n=1 Tax=Nelumbo nucifera TaxID=4432 RepID=A0A822XDR0_NELNU|nr:TPA_asm: hypothetical protein HUJ06_021047 [Nelumbo nucifera]